MKKFLYITIAILLICVIFWGGTYMDKKAKDNAYNNAITLIQNGSYEDALAALEKANPNILDRKNFKSDMEYGIDETYKNTLPLYSYALAQLEYNSEKKHMRTVNDYLDLIPADYSDELSEDIKTFRESFKPQYDEFLEEEKRKDEELRLKIEESNRQYYAKLKTIIPYKGMNESDINKTIMGKPYKSETEKNSWGEYYTKYYWRANDGETMLIVTCKDKAVTSVSRYGWGYYWTEDIKPVWNGKNPYKNKTSSSSSSYKKNSAKKSNDDPYNVNDYTDPEDFYYDNYDDFWEYEEAEDYFNEHHKD